MDNFLNNFRINRLAQKMQRGDKVSAGKIFDHFSPIIFRYIAKRISNRETSEELTQDIFLKIIKKIDRFDKNQGNFSAWIWQIVKNTLIDFYREKKDIIVPNFLDSFKNIASEDNHLESKLRAEDIAREIKNFSQEEQEVFNLYFISDLSYREIKEITGKSEGSLRTMIHRINNKLRKKLNGKGDGTI
jgi:RNA polymerase sigma-70 factor (ECF subfamily)